MMLLLVALIISRFRTREAKIHFTWMPSQRPGVPQHQPVRPFVETRIDRPYLWHWGDFSRVDLIQRYTSLYYTCFDPLIFKVSN